MKIGIRGHDFGKNSLDDLILKLQAKNFGLIQLALNKALKGVNFKLGDLNTEIASNIGNTLKKGNIKVEVLGCYVNPVDPNKEEREIALNRFKEHIKFAKNFGCNIVATETGTLNSDMSFNDDNHGEKAFSIICESIKELAKEAEKYGVIVGVEGVYVHTINTPDRMRRLLDTVRSNNVKVVFDPVNFLNIDNYKLQQEVIRKSIELFGDEIVVIHGKDFVIRDNKICVVPVGKGLLDYKPLISFLKKKKSKVNIILEDIKEEYMPDSVNFLRNIYEGI